MHQVGEHWRRARDLTKNTLSKSVPGSHVKGDSSKTHEMLTIVSFVELCGPGCPLHPKLCCAPKVALPPASLHQFPCISAHELRPTAVRSLLRRLLLPPPSSSRSCRCGRPLNSSGHHRAACAVAGVLGRRAFALEIAAARVWREAEGRVALNVGAQDMDLAALDQLDNRRIEVVADGLPLLSRSETPLGYRAGVSFAP